MDDVSFSISAESDFTEPFCSVKGWETQAEEGMLPIPVGQGTRGCLGKMSYGGTEALWGPEDGATNMER